MEFREAFRDDVPTLAKIRSFEWGKVEYWIARINGYLDKEKNPQKALEKRMIFVSADNEKIVGFVAGHLTTRFDCEGELQWINVIPKYRNKMIASDLIKLMAKWFVQQNANLVCVNVGPDNEKAIQFYKKHHAEKLNEHWMIWRGIKKVI